MVGITKSAFQIHGFTKYSDDIFLSISIPSKHHSPSQSSHTSLALKSSRLSACEWIGCMGDAVADSSFDANIYLFLLKKTILATWLHAFCQGDYSHHCRCVLIA